MNPDLTNLQPENISTVVTLLESAVTNKWWGMLAALVLAVLLMVLRLVKPQLTKAQVLLASAASATLPSIILVLSKPGIHAADVIGTTVQSVFMAAGLWNIALKNMGGGVAIESRLASAVAKDATSATAASNEVKKPEGLAEDPELFPKDSPK